MMDRKSKESVDASVPGYLTLISDEDLCLDEIPDIIGTEFLALHPYCEGEAGDLSFQTGDLVIVTDMKEDGWWYGFSGEQEGWFPGTYVEKSAEYTPLCFTDESIYINRDQYAALSQQRELTESNSMTRNKTTLARLAAAFKKFLRRNSSQGTALHPSAHEQGHGSLEGRLEASKATSSQECLNAAYNLEEQLSRRISAVAHVQQIMRQRKARALLVDIKSTDNDDGNATAQCSTANKWDRKQDRISSPVLLSTTASIVRRHRKGQSADSHSSQTQKAAQLQLATPVNPRRQDAAGRFPSRLLNTKLSASKSCETLDKLDTFDTPVKPFLSRSCETLDRIGNENDRADGGDGMLLAENCDKDVHCGATGRDVPQSHHSLLQELVNKQTNKQIPTRHKQCDYTGFPLPSSIEQGRKDARVVKNNSFVPKTSQKLTTASSHPNQSGVNDDTIRDPICAGTNSSSDKVGQAKQKSAPPRPPPPSQQAIDKHRQGKR